MDSKQLLHSGQLYDSSLCDLVDEQQRLLEKLYDFNATRIPANVVAVGSPCRVMRPIDERDEEVYFKGKKIPEELKKRK